MKWKYAIRLEKFIWLVHGMNSVRRPLVRYLCDSVKVFVKV